MKIQAPQEQIAKLRDLGLIVRVSHIRYGQVGEVTITGTRLQLRNSKAEIEPKGGKTRLVIQSGETGDTLARGEANCSDYDNFCRRLGVTIALGRALEQMK